MATGMAGLFGGQGPNAYINNLYAPLQQAQTAQQAQRLTALQALLGQVNADIQKPSVDYYGAAATDATNAANGAAQSLAAANPNAATQAMLRAIGAPQAQQDQVGQQNQTVFGGQGALQQYVSGALPASVFAADAQAHGDYLKSLPLQLAGIGAQGVAQLGAQAAKENQALGLQKIQDLQKARTDLANFVQSKQKAKLDAQKTAFSQAATQTRLQQGQQRLDLSAQTEAFNQKYKISNYNLAASKFSQQVLNQDRSYKLQLQSLGIRKAAAQRAAVAQEYKLHTNGFTPIEVQKFKTSAFNVAQNAYNGLDKSVSKDGKTHPPVDYQTAVKEMLSAGVPMSIAIPELDKVYKPGERGRPLVQNGTASFDFGGGVSDLTHAGGFLPTGLKFSMQRADQGRDIQTVPGAPILAPGDGFVVRVASDPGSGGAHFGPSYPIVHFTSGPYAGQTVYIGHTVSALSAGQKFKAGSPLSHTQQSGPMNGGAPSGWAEIGFAPGGSPGPFGQQPPF